MTTFGEYWSIPGLVAASDLSSYQYYAVKLASTAGQVKLASAATDQILGILQNDPGAGEAAEVAFLGICKAVAGGAIAAGSLLTSNSTGQLKATTTANDKVVGRAVEAASASGDLIAVLLSFSNY